MNNRYLYNPYGGVQNSLGVLSPRSKFSKRKIEILILNKKNVLNFISNDFLNIL